MGSNQFYIKNQCFEPIYKPIKVAVDIFTLKNTKNFDPHEGLEGNSVPASWFLRLSKNLTSSLLLALNL